ncbi:MAG: hypothetical protein QXL32_04055 [Candidatus Bathyarchaeia archaeon]
MRGSLSSILLLAILSPLPWMGKALGSDVPVEMSPGKVPPLGNNHYLRTPEVRVKAGFSRAIILQETVGDLLFSVTVEGRRRNIAIYIPPEFGVKGLDHVWTDITNDYRFISLSRLSDRDPIAPGWRRVLVSSERGIPPGSHFIRIFNVTAPSIVGRYFFKIYVDGASIGAENFPTLVVSADPNPAYISGTVLDGGRDPTRYGRPIRLEEGQGGMVIAEGVTRDGRVIVAQAFFNSSANGRYTLYGLAPGIYRLTASAAGYYNATKPEPVAVLAGQSLEGIDLHVSPSPRIEGIVWSKCGGFPCEWGSIGRRPGPMGGAALVYVGSGVLPGCDLIYAFRGGNSTDFFRYDAISDKWEPKRSAPGPVGPGGSLAFDGIQYIYALQGGGSRAFWRYDIVEDEWEALEDAPFPVGAGGSLVFCGGLIYALAGGGSSGFRYYDPVMGQWGGYLPDTPHPIGAGGSLVFADGSIYALAGGGTSHFWMYNLSDPALGWQTLASAPFSAKDGASMAYDPINKVIYALAGGGSGDFRYYSTTWMVWSSSLSSPDCVKSGGALAFDTSNGRLYAFLGGGSEAFRRYDPSSDSWGDAKSFPSLYPRPISIEILDSLGNSKRILQGLTDPESTRFDFSYGGEIKLDGHIPQDGAGYISGISPGSYILRAWANQYIQPSAVELPGLHIKATGVWIDLSSQDASKRIEFDIHRAGRAEITVHFKDYAGLKKATPIGSDKTLTVEIYDRDGTVWARNSTKVYAGNSSGSVILTGPLGTLRDYGIPKGTYGISVSIPGFYQPYDSYITISENNAATRMSLEVLKGGSLNITINPVDMQRPSIPRKWRHPGEPIRVEVRDRYGVEIIASNVTFQRLPPHEGEGARLSITGLRAGIYSIHIFTYGYVQPSPYYVSVFEGIMTDVSVDVMLGCELNITVILKKEGIFSNGVDTYPFSSRVPVRVQVLDSMNRFVAAATSHIPSDSKSFSLLLAGFRRYAGGYSDRRWINYYDTTDGSAQRDYGLAADSYRILVYVPGFMQSEEIVTPAPPQGGNVSIILSLERLAHLTGRVESFDGFGRLVYLNWARIDAIGINSRDSAPTLDGSFELWLKGGRYFIICFSDGYGMVSKEIAISDGSDSSLDFRLEAIPA